MQKIEWHRIHFHVITYSFHIISWTSIEIVDFSTDPDDLPHQSENQMRFAGVQVLRPDVDDVATNGSGRVQRQRQILVDLIYAQLASFVDRSLVDRPGLRQIH